MENEEVKVTYDENELAKPEVKEEPSTPQSIVETIIQNGVSKDELRSMLDEILNKPTPEQLKADIAKAEQEYFSSHLKY